MVERCARMSSTMRDSTAGQIEVRSSGPAAASDSWPASRPNAVMSSTGTLTLTSSVFEEAGATTETGRPPPRKAATSSTGRTVADRPMRWAGRGSSASSRSRLSARCAPRLVAATAWTSSTITVSTVRRLSRAALVSSRKRDSGVVMRMSAGARANPRRSAAGVSPLRTAMLTRAAGWPSRAAACRMPVSGAVRLRSTSTASALRGDT